MVLILGKKVVMRFTLMILPTIRMILSVKGRISG